jgi:hypothetical protein
VTEAVWLSAPLVPVILSA